MRKRFNVRFSPERSNWDTHVKVLAWIFIISAIFMAIPALVCWCFREYDDGNGVTCRFHLAGPLFLAIAVTFISIPVGIVIAGIGLLRYREWARVLTLVLAAFMLIGFPFGTAIGIYAFWVLLSSEGSAHTEIIPLRSGEGGPIPECAG